MDLAPTILEAAGVAWLDRAARRLAEAPPREVATLLGSVCPTIAAQARADRHGPHLALWGRSRNVDDHAGAQIVRPEILDAIGALAGLRMRGGGVHAGLIHTYGYLLSLLPTPYGLKRERWVSGALERGLGLPDGLLGPAPARGTLLANVTALAARILVPGVPVDRERSAPEIGSIDLRGLRHQRIVEVAREPLAVTFTTDLLALRFPSPGSEVLLIYAVARGSHGPRLVTVFPVTADAARRLVEDATGPGVVPQRYNVFVHGVRRAELRGERYVIER